MSHPPSDLAKLKINTFHLEYSYPEIERYHAIIAHKHSTTCSSKGDSAVPGAPEAPKQI